MEKLRICYLDRVPCNKPFYYPVKNLEEAKLVIDVLAKRDLYDDRITDNVFELQTIKDKEWEVWENERGETIDDILEE